MAEIAYVGLGSNLGDRRTSMDAAVRRMSTIPGVRLRKVSSFRETDPEGVPNQPAFLNGVAEIECSLPPSELLAHLQRIETELGRIRTRRWGPRTVDLDLLLFGTRRLRSERLNVPHPRLVERRFALEPLAELCPDRIVPGTRRTVRRHLELLGERAHT